MFEFARWVGGTKLSVAIQSTLWLTPLLQAIHIVMIGIVFVSVLVIVLRIHGRERADEPFDQVWRRFAPWLWSALVVMAVTGAVLIVSEPLLEAKALTFWLKMFLIVAAIASVIGLRRSTAGISGMTVPGSTRLADTFVLLIRIV